jgi:tRNA threonylcarbamoyladenosine biosynthesis protein TsaB
MPAILSLETSSTSCSVAFHREGRLIGLVEIREEQAHAAKLAGLIHSLLNTLETDIQSLDAFAVVSGPGSYTGLRIGTSTAKGLCLATGKPLLAVDTLTLLARKVQNMGLTEGLLCPLIDARRMEVYTSLFDVGLNQLEPLRSVVVDEESFRDKLDAQIVTFFGNGAAKCRGVVQHPNARFIFNINPSAAELGDLASEKLERNNIEDLVHFEPIYLKEFLVKKPTKISSVLNK